MSAYLGDFRTGKTIRKMWNSNAIAGESITRATNGTVSVYKDGGVTQSTTGVTDTEDFDSLTGVHLVAIDTSADGTFYSAGSEFEVVLSAATIDGKTINATLFSFSLENRSALMPTTDGRRLDVSAGGEAGLDWANVGSPTTTVGLSGTTVKTATDVETGTADIQSRLPAALVSGRMSSDVIAISGDTAAADNLERWFDGTVGFATSGGNLGLGNLACSAGVTITQSTTDGHGVSIIGNGDGAGIFVNSGATGSGIVVQATESGLYVGGNNAGLEVDGAFTASHASNNINLGANALTAAVLAADAVTEIQSGLSTLTEAGVRTAVGLASANLDTQLAAIPTAAQNADGLLGRNVSGGSSSGRTVKQALHFLRNKWVVSGGVLTVYDTDDTTESWAANMSSSSGADPITGSDPS